MTTHKEALQEAVDAYYGPEDTIITAMEAAIRAYLEARGLVMVPKEPTHRMTVEGHAALDDTEYTQTKALGSLMGRMAFGDVYRAMLAAFPYPFSEG